jgi:hypothetical protein
LQGFSRSRLFGVTGGVMVGVNLACRSRHRQLGPHRPPASISSGLAMPVQPLLERFISALAMFKDYWKYEWVLPVY